MTDEPKDPPIKEMDFVGGTTVIDIGDHRIARGLSRRPHTVCRHIGMVYDPRERRIWCTDCERNLDPFDAFELLVDAWHKNTRKLDKRREELAEAESKSLVSLAARGLDKIWRKRLQLPACPSCGEGLFPEDFKHGVTRTVSRQLAYAKRRASLPTQGEKG